MSTQQLSKMEHLREKLKELRLERDHVVMQKGLAALDNNDLRENFEYDYWEQKEHVLTVRIKNLIEEIEDLAQNTKP